MQSKFYFHFDIFIFENKVSLVTGRKMELDKQFALFPVAVECPNNYPNFKKQSDDFKSIKHY